MLEHGHSHNHAITSVDAQTLGEENKKHYDDYASKMRDQPWIAALGVQIAKELPAEMSWIGAKTGTDAKLLDYACGDGIASFALSEHFPTLRGIDVSAGSVAQYNALAQSRHGLPAEQAHAVIGNLATDPDAVPEMRDFDLIVMSMALHHVADPAGVLRALTARLRPDGGVLLIVDWVTFEESGCGMPALLLRPQTEEEKVLARTVARFGFREADVRSAFAEAGLEEFGWRYFTETSEVPEPMGGRQQLFMARGVRRGGEL